MITAEQKTQFTTSPRQQSLRINDFGFDFVRFTIFDTDYSITDPELFKAVFEPSYRVEAQEGNIISMVYDIPSPSEIDWKGFIFTNYDAKRKEVVC